MPKLKNRMFCLLLGKIVHNLNFSFLITRKNKADKTFLKAFTTNSAHDFSGNIRYLQIQMYLSALKNFGHVQGSSSQISQTISQVAIKVAYYHTQTSGMDLLQSFADATPPTYL